MTGELDRDRLLADLRADEAEGPVHPDYEIGEVLGVGGMGSIHRAFDKKLRRPVAMKILRRADFGERFVNEALSTAELEHPNILPVFDRGELEDGRPFYTMRLVEGRDLDALLGEGPAGEGARLRDAVRVLATVCEALGHAHARGFVHRDVKPGNVMVGDRGEIWVVDWGLLARVGSTEPTPEGSGGEANLRETAAGQVLGTFGYLSPEQARGELEVGPPADVFAAGCILFRTLHGDAPYADLSAPEVLARLRSGDPPAWSASSSSRLRPLESIARRAMAQAPAHRYPTGAELAADLRRWLEGQPVEAHREGFFERLGRLADKNRELLALVVVYLVIRAVLLVVTRG